MPVWICSLHRAAPPWSIDHHPSGATAPRLTASASTSIVEVRRRRRRRTEAKSASGLRVLGLFCWSRRCAWRSERCDTSDWPAVKAIYEQGIATQQATFETAAPAWEDWDAAHLADHRLGRRAGRRRWSAGRRSRRPRAVPATRAWSRTASTSPREPAGRGSARRCSSSSLAERGPGRLLDGAGVDLPRERRQHRASTSAAASGSSARGSESDNSTASGGTPCYWKGGALELGQGGGSRDPRADRDRDRRGRGRDRPRRRHRDRGGRPRPPARDHARVPRAASSSRASCRRRCSSSSRRTRRRRRVVEAIVDAARSGNESGDGIVLDDPDRVRDAQPNRQRAGGSGGGRMTNKELLYAASTIWVVIAAVLVMFMQAGFAFLEAGLTRMKNVGHIAAKNVLIFALASVVYYLVGFGIAFGDGGNGLVGGSGFFPEHRGPDRRSAQAPFSWFSEIPGAAGYLFEVVFCGVSLAIVWGAMAERTKLYVYIVFGVAFTLVYSVVSHWIWSPDGWLFSKGMQDFAGSTVVHYQGALAALAGALLLGPRIGKFGADGKANAIPGHNMAYTTLGVHHPLVRLVRVQPGLDPRRSTSAALGFFAYVALNTNIAAAAGVFGALDHLVARDQEAGHLDDAQRRDRRPRRDHRRLRVRRAVGGARDRLRRRRDRRPRRPPRRADRHRRPDRRGRRPRHGRRLGHALPRPADAPLAGEEPGDRLEGPLLRRRPAPARRPGARARRRRRVHVRRVVPDPPRAEADVGHPRRAGGRDRRARRPRARHVGLPRVLHPGSGRLRHGVARPPRARARLPQPAVAGATVHQASSLPGTSG